MIELRFANNDLIPTMGIGTWLSKPNEVYNAIITAIKAGYRHIDCAYIYKNEKEIGDALQFAFKNGLVKREELFITSKLWNNSHEMAQIEPAIKQTLKDLQLDYLDLYLMHWPIAFKWEFEQVKSVENLASLKDIPLEETWLGMAELKKNGLTKHIGVSNFSQKKLQHLIDTTQIVPENNQIEIHPYFQQKKLRSYCTQNNIVVTAYSPLGSRHLTKSENGISENLIIKNMAERYNCTPAQVILAWGMAQGISIIPKSTNTDRIYENYNAVNVHLRPEDIDAINMVDENNRQSKGLFAVLPDGYYSYANIWDEDPFVLLKK